MNRTYRYGIYGGSFDPVHVGHVALADCAVRECGLDELVFMPAYMSPFKQNREVTDGGDRLAMIRTVLGYNSAFRVSDHEIVKGGPSYTIETLQYMDGHIAGELYFVLGMDSVIQLDKWYMGEDILRNYRLVTASRPDTDDSGALDIIDSFRKKYGAEIMVLGMQPVDASSTEIRNRVKAGLPVSGMLLPETEEYIIEHKLYR